MIPEKSPLDYALEEVKELVDDTKKLKEQMKEMQRDLKFAKNERDLLANELKLVKREREKEQQKHHLLREYIFLNG